MSRQVERKWRSGDHLGYLARQLRRRGFSHPARLAEGMEVAQQALALHILSSGAVPPGGWRELRAVLDRAVYAATRELRQRHRSLSEYDELLGDRGAGRSSCEADDAEVAALRDQVERLPVEGRLVVKLKHAEVFLPGLAAGAPVSWERDEAEYLRLRHRRPLAAVEAELRTRLLGDPDRCRDRVPAAVIAWLLGRASPDAVNTAYHDIKLQLRRAVPPTDAAILVYRLVLRATISVHFRDMASFFGGRVWPFLGGPDDLFVRVAPATRGRGGADGLHSAGLISAPLVASRPGRANRPGHPLVEYL